MLEKFRILFLAANPQNTLCSLRLDTEIRKIDESIRIAPFATSFELHSVWSVRPIDLLTALLRYQPNIIHFSGHGSELEGLLLENNEGDSQPVSLDALAGLLKSVDFKINTILLNVCLLGEQLEALNGVADYVIGMRQSITDKAAIAFVASFYKALAFGSPIIASFEIARSQLAIEGFEAQEIPILLTREQNPLHPSLGVPSTILASSERKGSPTNRDAIMLSENLRSVSDTVKDKKKRNKIGRKKQNTQCSLSKTEHDEINELIKKIQSDLKSLSKKLSKRS